LKNSGDPLGTKSDEEAKMNICLPANIRWKMYETKEDVKLENKFAGIPLTVPLVSNMKDSYK